MKTADLIARVEAYDGIRAGVAALSSVLAGPSFRAEPNWHPGAFRADGPETFQTLPGSGSLLVMGLAHPEDQPRLDWWDGGDTWGNRQLRKIASELARWIRNDAGIEARPLPYDVEKGGLFLKDAAALCGLGVVGKSNLLLHNRWGPRIRLKAVFIDADLAPTPVLAGFDPCSSCDRFCQRACPKAAFPNEIYSRFRCRIQMAEDIRNKTDNGKPDKDGNPSPVIRYCRACEFSCPVGA